MSHRKHSNLSIYAGEIGNIANDGLKHELAAIQYEIVAERTVKVLSKAAIKKITGRSPDLADALAYANWAKRAVRQIVLPISGGR